MRFINIFKPLSTFLWAALLNNQSSMYNFCSDNISGMLGIEPGEAGFQSKFANYSEMLPIYKSTFCK